MRHIVKETVIMMIKRRPNGTHIVSYSLFQTKSPTNLVLQDTVEPRNEYFSSQFLVAFSCTGQHELTVIASVRDEAGALWETGPQVIVYVDVIEHGAIRRSGTVA